MVCFSSVRFCVYTAADFFKQTALMKGLNAQNISYTPNLWVKNIPYQPLLIETHSHLKTQYHRPLPQLNAD